MFSNLYKIKNAEILNHDAIINSKVFELEKKQAEAMESSYKEPDLDVKILLYDINKLISEIEQKTQTLIAEIGTKNAREKLDGAPLLQNYNQLSNFLNLKAFRSLPQRIQSSVTDKIDALVEPVNALIVTAKDNLSRVQKEMVGRDISNVRQYFPLFNEVNMMYNNLLYKTYDIVRSKQLAQDIIAVSKGDAELASQVPPVLRPRKRTDDISQYTVDQISNIEILKADNAELKRTITSDRRILGDIKNIIERLNEDIDNPEKARQRDANLKQKQIEEEKYGKLFEQIGLNVKQLAENLLEIESIKNTIEKPEDYDKAEGRIGPELETGEKGSKTERDILISEIDEKLGASSSYPVNSDVDYIKDGKVKDRITDQTRDATIDELRMLQRLRGTAKTNKEIISKHRFMRMGRGIVPIDRGDWLYETY